MFWLFSYNYNPFTLELQNQQIAGLQTWTLIRPKLIVPAASLALSQRTTNNLDEASIKAKHQQTFKYNPHLRCYIIHNNNHSIFVIFRKPAVMP